MEVKQMSQPYNKCPRERKRSHSTTTEHHVSVCNPSSPKIKTYLYANWNGALYLPPPPTLDGTIISMSGYDIFDTVGGLNDLMLFDKTDHGMIVGKVSSRKANNHSASNEKTRQLMVDIPGVKPKAKRGQQTDGVSKHYSFFGHRKDPLYSGELGEYCFKKNCSNEKIKNVTAGIATLCCQMEEMGQTLIRRLECHTQFKRVKKALNLPSVGGGERSLATQFSAGDGYWSPIHHDPDHYVSVLSVLSHKKK